jgi:3-oxoacyl-[acyl-carrier protein] reductase
MTSDTGILAGKSVLIAGLGSGLGGATARLFAQQGADIAAIDSVAQPALDILSEIRATGRRARLHQADLRNEDEVRAAFASILSDLGRLDILVTVAGGNTNYQSLRPLLEWERSDWDEIFERNIDYVFLIVREALRAMTTQPDGGAIVMVGSMSGSVTAPNHAAYGAAKAGIASLARSLAAEYGSHGVRVNVVAPGAIDNPATAALHANFDANNPQSSSLAHIPLGRMGGPVEIANAILFLASPMGSYVTGQTLLVDGGASVVWPLTNHRPDAPTSS